MRLILVLVNKYVTSTKYNLFNLIVFVLEYYEEALNLVSDLTSIEVSNNMWGVLELIYRVSYLLFLTELLRYTNVLKQYMYRIFNFVID